MRIGRLAELTGPSLRTIRFHDEVGVLASVPRTNGGFRVFTGNDLRRPLLLLRMKPLGFSVEGCGLPLEPTTSCWRARRIQNGRRRHSSYVLTGPV